MEEKTRAQLLKEIEALRQQLTDTESRWRSLTEGSPDHILALDTELCIQYANFASPGLTIEELLGTPLYTYAEPARQAEIKAILEGVLRTGQPATYETAYDTPDGGTIHYESRVAPRRGPGSDEIVGLTLVARDITRQVQAEQTLRQSHAWLQSILRIAPTGIGVVSNRVILDVNDRFCEMTGYAREELIGQSARVLYPTDEDYEFVGRVKYAQIRAHGTGAVETRFKRRDGQIIHVWLSSTPLDPADPDAGVTFTALNITERVQAEQTLRESEEKYRTLFESAPESIALISVDGTVLDCNAATGEIAGRPREELIGRPFTELGVLPADDLPRYVALFQQTMDRKRLSRMELKSLRPDGSARWLEVFPALLKKEGQVRAIQVITRDVTARVQAEEALRESEEKYRQLFDLESDAIFLIENESGRILEANAAASAMYGYSREELLTKKNTDLSAEPEQTRSATVSGATSVPVHYHRKKNGTVFPVEITARHFDWQGKPVHIAAIRDITQRMQAEQALRASEERFRLAAGVASDLIYEWDVNSDALEWYGGFDEALGYRPGEIPRTIEAWGGLIHPDDREKLGALVELHHTSTEPIYTTYRMQHRDGHWRDWIDRGTPLVDDAGRPYKWIGACIDITQQVQGEKERERLLTQIQDQARRVQQIIDTVPEGVLLLDCDGRVLTANPVAERNLEALSGAQVGEIITDLGDRPLAELLTSPPKGMRHEVRAGNRTFKVVARPIENGPTPEHWVLALRDVTREREAQAQIQRQERLATVGQLAAGIAHDFNNIMGNIVLYSGIMLRSSKVTTHDRERLEVIRSQGHHAARLVEQILDFARQSSMERRPLDLVPFLKEIEKLWTRTLPEDILLRLKYGRDDYTVNADPTRLQQALMNLVINARDAMPNGGKLDIELTRVGVNKESDGWVNITVTDTGTGISPETLPHIFDPFFTTKAPGAGSGLGLAQVYGIVQQHDGEIDVQSQVGQGTTFIVHLPALPIRRSDAAEKETAPLILGHGETILVVEDNPTMRETLVESLEMLRYRAVSAMNGHEALEILERRPDPVDLVLSDLVMPDMGGAALFHALRQTRPDMPMVILTGHAMRKEMENLRAQGLSAWLPKPPQLEDLSDVLAGVLEKR